MRNNIGYIDKFIRVSIFLTISLLILTSIIRGSVAMAGIILITFLMITCLSGYCPLYRLLKLNSRRNLNEKARIYERNQQFMKI